MLAAALAVPATAGASPRQFSILQDDAVLPGRTAADPDEAMAEAKSLGVDVVRAFVSWRAVSPSPRSRQMPPDLDVGNPDAPGYDWSAYDSFIARARRHGLAVFLTLAPPIPYWASEEPNRCPHHIGGYKNFRFSCMWKPRPRLFYQFAKAVALRYGSAAQGPHGGQVTYYSLWNEPNLEHYLYPQFRRTRYGRVDFGAKRYRELWYEGWKAIARYDPARRGNVLFGETAAISSPLDTLFGALCLDEHGRPFRGMMRKLQGCMRPRKLPIGGMAVHPYNNEAKGTVFTRSFTLDSLPMAYLPRLHRLMDHAAAKGRIPRGKGIFLTEFGFQSNPPDSVRGLSLDRHAQAINEADRLFFADRRVKAVAQFELYDPPELRNQDVYNTGLRENGGVKKPAWQAYRMPVVVTKLSRDMVEVWGQVRPADGRVRPVITAARPGEELVPIDTPLTNPSGYFRVRVRRRGASNLDYRTEWVDSEGHTMRSRVARAGKRIRYLKDPKPRKRAQPRPVAPKQAPRRSFGNTARH